jgi:hypothetical protein
MLLENSVGSVPPEEWASRYYHARSFLEHYLEDEGKLDDTADRRLVTNLKSSTNEDGKSRNFTNENPIVTKRKQIAELND